MTPVRRFAMRIAGLVVRYASPGCREWAEGLAREAEFIEDDWSALRWAIGSTRVLLDRREAPMTSPGDVADRARRFSEWVRKGTVTYVFLLLWVFNYVLRLLNAGSSPRQRIICALAVLTAICIGVVELIQRRRQQAPPSADVGDWLRYYGSELERQRDFYLSGIGAWYHLVLMIFAIFIGNVFAQGGGFRQNPIFLTYGVLVYLLWESFVIRQTRRFQRQIDEVNAVLQGER